MAALFQQLHLAAEMVGVRHDERALGAVEFQRYMLVARHIEAHAICTTAPFSKARTPETWVAT